MTEQYYYSGTKTGLCSQTRTLCISHKIPLLNFQLLQAVIMVMVYSAEIKKTRQIRAA